MATIIFNASDIETVQPMTADTKDTKSAEANSSLFTLQSSLKTAKDIPEDVRHAVPFAAWLDAHPIVSTIFMAIMAVMTFYAVLFYDFTIH